MESKPSVQPSPGFAKRSVHVVPEQRHVVISSATLLQGCNEIHIEHASGRYSLRQTRTGKLILTK